MVKIFIGDVQPPHIHDYNFNCGAIHNSGITFAAIELFKAYTGT